jgi:carbon storage regulator CsrA
MDFFTRKRNEEIVIDDSIFVRIVEIRDDKVRIGIECPKEMPVHRRETLDALRCFETMPDMREQVRKTYPPEGNLQLMRLKAATEFNCSRCKTTKKARLVAVVAGDWNQLLCNGCYGDVLLERGEE